MLRPGHIDRYLTSVMSFRDFKCGSLYDTKRKSSPMVTNKCLLMLHLSFNLHKNTHNFLMHRKLPFIDQTKSQKAFKSWNYLVRYHLILFRAFIWNYFIDRFCNESNGKIFLLAYCSANISYFDKVLLDHIWFIKARIDSCTSVYVFVFILKIVYIFVTISCRHESLFENDRFISNCCNFI